MITNSSTTVSTFKGQSYLITIFPYFKLYFTHHIFLFKEQIKKAKNAYINVISITNVSCTYLFGWPKTNELIISNTIVANLHGNQRKARHA